MSTKLQPADSSSVFDISLRYGPYAETLRKRLFEKAIEKVSQWDLGQPEWKLSKEAKKLAGETFSEYSEDLRATFNQPNYSFWLSNSLEAQKRAFIPDLLKQINSKIPNDDN
jgi:hypothetical protein